MKHRDSLSWTFPRAAIAVLLLLFCTINTTLAQTTLPAEDIAEKALAATVYLEMKDSNGKILGFGSGFFIKSNLIATNYHVIEGAARGTAKLVGKHATYNIEGTTATDKANDLALLKVTAYGIKPLPIGDSETVRIGETVYVAGNPKGLEGTFSDGIISSHRERSTKERLQMTAPISPGSSGGPVLNGKGEVIGVSYMTLEGGQNLNFAIPSRYLKALIARSGTSKPFSPEKQSVSAKTYFRWGNTKYDLGNYKAAITDYDMAIRLKPDYVYAYNNRGITKAKLGKHFEAITDFDMAIELKSDYARAYLNRGVTKTNLGKHFEAITDFDVVIRLQPDNAYAYNGRGDAKFNLSQYSAAISDYNIAIRFKLDYVEAYRNRGNAKVRLKQYIAAITDYDEVIRLTPNYAVAYVNRGMAKLHLKRTLEAKRDFLTGLGIAKRTGHKSMQATIEGILEHIESIEWILQRLESME